VRTFLRFLVRLFPPSFRAHFGAAIVEHAAMYARRLLEGTITDLRHDLGDENTPLEQVLRQRCARPSRSRVRSRIAPFPAMTPIA